MYIRHSDEECSRSSQDWSGGEATFTYKGGSAAQDISFTSLRQLMPGRELPEAETLSDPDLISLLNDIEFDLLQHRVRVDFLDTLPARVAYKGILQLLDSPLETDDGLRSVLHLDGCDSACESCFQLAHCAIAREVLGSEWRLAVEQAGINPGWSALFSKEAE